jgi:hypothetical protein
VLYVPFDEFDVDEWPDGRPEDGYFDDLCCRMAEVKGDLEGQDPRRTRHRLIRTETDLDEVLASQSLVGFSYCVEGGFHLGVALDKIDARVKQLADEGVSTPRSPNCSPARSG